ncbi:MAG: Protein-arginine kinase [Opitutia bacterium UBA7350]|nr:MAG: Protein-arginine kinase [Opitutae bacterium UBA7350]
MIESIIDGKKAELTQSSKRTSPVVLSTRIRLARNLVGVPFPQRANLSQRRDVLSDCVTQLGRLDIMKLGTFFELEELSSLEKQVLLERHLISNELKEGAKGCGVYINSDQTCSIMINEEDHIRIQFLKTGFNLKSLWKRINAFDDAIDEYLDLAYSKDLGYLTACPTNLGTGMRASVMMHLPGLVLSGNMDKITRAVGQLGIVVRGHFGEGSDVTGHIFQISNQYTLGESEAEILERLGNVLKGIIDQEINARFKYHEEQPDLLLDQIGRAYGVLQNAHVLSSNEAMQVLSLIRLAVDFGFLPETRRAEVDRCFIECQPGHIQYDAKTDIEPELRDIARAAKLRSVFSKLPPLSFDNKDESK